MWLAVDASGRRGRMTSGSCIRCHISSVTRPVASSRGVCMTSFSNAHTAARVRPPNCPSIGPGSKPSSFSRSWTIVTSSPYEPSPIVWASVVLTIGRRRRRGLHDGAVVVAADGRRRARRRGSCRADGPPSPNPPATPATTTVPSRAAAATAGSIRVVPRSGRGIGGLTARGTLGRCATLPAADRSGPRRSRRSALDGRPAGGASARRAAWPSRAGS